MSTLNGDSFQAEMSSVRGVTVESVVEGQTDRVAPEDQDIRHRNKKSSSSSSPRKSVPEGKAREEQRRSQQPREKTNQAPRSAKSRRKDEREGEVDQAHADFLFGLLRPFKMAFLVAWTFRSVLLYVAGFALGAMLLQHLASSLLSRFHLPSFSNFLPGPLNATLAKMDVCVLPLASICFPACAQQKRSAQELRRRLGLAESTELVVKFTSGMVDLVAQTPQAQYVQQVSNGAHTLSQAFKMRSTVPSAELISLDLERIGDETEKMVDSVIEVEVQGRVAVADMVAGNRELVNMLAKPNRYSADLVERRLDRLVDNTDSVLEALQLQLVSAQKSASRVLALQRQLRGKLFAEQSDLQEQDVEDRSARSFLTALRRPFDQGLTKPLSAIENFRLQKNLDLVTVAVDDVQDWSARFSDFSLYLRSYRSQVSARKRQLSQHQWTSAELTVEDRIQAIGRLLEPAQQRLAELEKTAERQGDEHREGRPSLDSPPSP
ncbi:unnamed protein product [Tilletia laevis]|nr:hypothetical protein CF336_g5339 [Tilletia laevis]CAD6917568.1 unnamed protein product [Tilletia controversa]KAE8197551.1 hypothetical protein CF335_g4589 [Tilletia laevis]CAD6936217.1 unnamed protein product [Tilletia laevis]CAD6964237.1 unnamed protein product [Tilletia controversa]